MSNHLYIAPRNDCHGNYRAHVMHFNSEDAKAWVDNDLTEMLRRMNVVEEHVIAGRLWVKEILRMIGEGYKVIVVISKDIIKTNEFEIAFHQIITKQNCREPCLIPIMFNCSLHDYDELSPYVALRHDQTDLYDRLRQAICNRCNLTNQNVV